MNFQNFPLPAVELWVSTVQLCFGAKRKLLRNVLKPKYGYEQTTEAISSALGSDPEIVRPQDLALEHFIVLFDALGPPPPS